MLKRIRIIAFILSLTLIDQIIKIYIDKNMMEQEFNIFGDFSFIQFNPVFNHKFSWLNSLFNLGISLIIHIVVVALILTFSCIMYSYVLSKSKGLMVNVVFILLISGELCSLIDKIFWGGSLDYILLKGLFTFDSKDLYITFFDVLGMGLLIFNYKKIRNVTGLELMRDFIKFNKSKIIKR